MGKLKHRLQQLESSPRFRQLPATSDDWERAWTQLVTALELLQFEREGNESMADWIGRAIGITSRELRTMINELADGNLEPFHPGSPKWNFGGLLAIGSGKAACR